MPDHPEAFFMPAEDGGQRFCLFHPAQRNRPLGTVLYVHPFAEEMNKSRRMASLQARAFARAGYAVLQIDLLGCGDSTGDSGDARWQDWVCDVVRGSRWLHERSDAAMWLWGLRAGCLVAAEAAARLPARSNFIFWAPVLAGKTHLQQFLRLAAAGNLLDGNAKGVTDALRKKLIAGDAIEVAGYQVSPDLANGFEQSMLTPSESLPWQLSPRVEWFEMSTRQDAVLGPAAVAAITRWRERGFTVRGHVVGGPSFWQTTEIEDAPDLIEATVHAMAHVPTMQAAPV